MNEPMPLPSIPAFALRLRLADGLVVAALGGLAAYYVFAWDTTTGHGGLLALDIYGYYYPNMLHAVAAVADGGRGLWWNALQDCGQPFFGISSTGILYPLNALFLLLDADLALRGVIVLNLVVAGVGAYLLCRELGTGRLAAAAGAMAFELGCSTLNVSTWTPFVSGPYVWLPLALLFCERCLRHPSPPNGIGLAVILAIALLPGFPQTVVFAYQLIALRVAWEIVMRRGRARAFVATIILGLVLAPLLAAVQLVPALESARMSVRGGNLSAEEISPGGAETWSGLRTEFGRRQDINNPLIVLPAIVAAASLARARTRRRALPYAVGAVLFFVLAFGPATPLFDLYRFVPPGSVFRDPHRFLWSTSFCLAVLTGLGTEALSTVGEDDRGAVRRLVPVLFTTMALFALYGLSPTGLRAGEWVLAGLGLGAALVAAMAPARASIAAAVIVAAIGINLVAYPLGIPALAGANRWSLRMATMRRLVASGEELRVRAPVFRALRARMTAQDRVYLVYWDIKAPLLAKTPALFGIPGVLDYEPQPSRRYAAYLVMMRTGLAMTSLNQLYVPLQGFMPKGVFRRRLLDLAAGRYLVVDPKYDTTTALSPPPELVTSAEDLRVYENPLALPRAFYVPRVEIVANEDDLLQRLAFGSDDLRQLAFVEEPPLSGFVGVPGNTATGEVEFLRNDPEDVVLRVSAPERGFLHLADQYAPGWSATVNGSPSPILRANYLFRVIEVPAGESRVELRYGPGSIVVGGIISTVSILAAVAALVFWPRRESDSRT